MNNSACLVDSERLNESVRSNIVTLCEHFLPAGKKESGEWKIADVTGAKGDSLGIQLTGPKAGLWHDRATRQGGTFVELLMQNRGITFLEAVELIERDLGINLRQAPESFGDSQWQECVKRMSHAKRKELCAYRGYSAPFVDWLVETSLIGIFKDKHGIERWAFPFQHEGKVAAIHCEIQKGKEGRKHWFYHPKLSDLGLKIAPFVLGDLSNATEVHIHESQWDLLAHADVIGFDTESQGIGLMATRGSANGALAEVVNKLEAKIYLWPQRDIVNKDGKIPAKEWLRVVQETLRRPANVCWISDLAPDRNFDFNDWTRSTTICSDNLEQIMGEAELFVPPVPEKKLPPFAAGREDIEAAATSAKKVKPQPPEDNPPQEIASDEESQLLKRLVATYGPPAYENADGDITKLNEGFWAALRAAETHTIYSPEERAFYRYNEERGIYEHWINEAILKDLSQRIFQASTSWGQKWLRLANLRSYTALKLTAEFFRSETECKDAWRSDRYWSPVIACKNFLVRIDSDNVEIVVEPFSPKYRLRHGSPFAYDQKATCPKFEKHILGHLGEDDRLLLQKLGGQCLLGRNLCQRIVILDGIASSSKSAFLAILRGILGATACAELRTALLGERFEIGAVARADILCGSDVPGDFLSRKGADRLKALVGSDLLECELKNSNLRFWITGLFNVFISANTALHVRLHGDYSAWRRRLLRIHYETPYFGPKILKIDEYLLDKEGPGILNFFLQGALALLRDVQETGDLRVPGKHQTLVETLLAESDSLATYLQEEIQKTGYGEGGITTEEILEGYMTYCTQQGWDATKASAVRRELPDLMSHLFNASASNNLERFGKKNARGYRKVDFKEHAGPTSEDWK